MRVSLKTPKHRYRATCTTSIKESKGFEEAVSRLAAIVESSDDAIIGKTLDGTITSWNKGAVKMYGYTPEEVIGRSISILAPPYIPDEIPHILDRIKRGEAVDHYQTERVTKDGRYIYASITVSPIRDWTGKIIGASTIARDITELRQAEDELRRSEERLRIIFNNAAVGIAEVDEKDRFIAANDRIYEILGYNREELLGMDVDQITSPQDRPRSDELNRQLIEGRFNTFSYEKRYLRRDGSPIWVHVTASAIRDSNGRFMRAIGTIEDISDRKRAEEELRILNAELEQRVAERTMEISQRTAELEAVNKELEAFSYSVSHDLRAPLRAIDGFSLALLKNYQDKLDERGKDYLQRVRNAAQRMAQLIDDILGLSRATRVEMRRQTVDLSEVAMDILSERQESQPERKVEIFIQPDVVADADPHLMRIALGNLLGNAWKFTGNKAVACIEFGTVQKDGERVYFIRDNGAGFDMAYADKLFTPFQRMHTEAEFSGTGVGLALVQRIIRRHGGRVWAESQVEQGSTFFFTLGEQNK